MEDQVMHLSSNNVPAAFLGSAQTDSTVEGRAIRGDYAIVYLTPEKAVRWLDGIKSMSENTKGGICLIAIDESHCVSEWGHDFRMEYRQLGLIRRNFPNIPLMALTATATPKVQSDILTNLALRDDLLIAKTTFNRPNLSYSVSKKSPGKVYDDLIPLLSKPSSENDTNDSEGSIVIYVPKQDFRLRHIMLVWTSSGERHYIDASSSMKFAFWLPQPLSEWIFDESSITGPQRVLNRTTNKQGAQDVTDCRLIVIFSIDMSNMTQMVMSDLERIEDPYYREEVMKLHMNLLNGFKSYLYTAKCRRQTILDYFGDVTCDNCDNCAYALKAGTTAAQRQNLAVEAYLFMKAIDESGGRWGLGIPMNIVLGIEKKKHQGRAIRRLFGLGRHRDKSFWKGFANILEQEGNEPATGLRWYFEVLKLVAGMIVSSASANKFIGPTYSLSPKGTRFLQDCRTSGLAEAVLNSQQPVDGATKFEVDLPASLLQGSFSQARGDIAQTTPRKRPRDVDLTPVEQELFKQLSDWRLERARKDKVPPFTVMHNQTFVQMCKALPTTEQSMISIDGIGERKMALYGSDLTALIKSFCSERDVDTDRSVRAATPPAATTPMVAQNYGVEMTSRQAEVLALFEQGMTPEDIAHSSNVKLRMVETQLEQAMKAASSRFPPPILAYWNRFQIPEEICTFVYSCLDELVQAGSSLQRLTPIMKALESKDPTVQVTWWQLSLLRLKYETEMQIAESTEQKAEELKTIEPPTKKRTMPWQSSQSSQPAAPRYAPSDIVPHHLAKTYSAPQRNRFFSSSSGTPTKADANARPAWSSSTSTPQSGTPIASPVNAGPSQTAGPVTKGELLQFINSCGSGGVGRDGFTRHFGARPVDAALTQLADDYEIYEQNGVWRPL
ncbi:hypothetical protein HDV00_011940 [Rhizophlyctis rosea]|nr:hypothetical protein HDV00_011940 [Rhizophlyctis rosea]